MTWRNPTYHRRRVQRLMAEEQQRQAHAHHARQLRDMANAVAHAIAHAAPLPAADPAADPADAPQLAALRAQLH